MKSSTFDMHLLGPYLNILGLTGAIILIVITWRIHRYYGRGPGQNFHWQMRNWRFKQISAVASLFFLAIASSYWVLQDPWGWVYLLVAFKTGTNWVWRVMMQHI